MQVDENQLGAWREEQYRIAETNTIPDQCSFITTDACSDSANHEYQNRYDHCKIRSTQIQHSKTLLIGGVDVTFPKDAYQQEAIAVYVILSYSSFIISPTVLYRSHQTFIPPPYIPSYLSFRESPPLLSLIKQQLKSYPKYRPHVIMVDGNGMWHERRAGLACFIGQCGIPCIGIGKSWYSLNGRDLDVKRAVKKSVSEWHNLFVSKESSQALDHSQQSVIYDSVPFTDEDTSPSTTKHRDDATSSMEEILSSLHKASYGLAVPMHDDKKSGAEILAYALMGHGGRPTRLKCGTRVLVPRGSKNPIYISAGNNITLRDAVALVASTCGESRIPEPVREADLYGR